MYSAHYIESNVVFHDRHLENVRERTNILTQSKELCHNFHVNKSTKASLGSHCCCPSCKELSTVCVRPFIHIIICEILKADNWLMITPESLMFERGFEPRFSELTSPTLSLISLDSGPPTAIFHFYKEIGSAFLFF